MPVQQLTGTVRVHGLQMVSKIPKRDLDLLEAQRSVKFTLLAGMLSQHSGFLFPIAMSQSSVKNDLEGTDSMLKAPQKCFAQSGLANSAHPGH